jgi:hypothetical protein
MNYACRFDASKFLIEPLELVGEPFMVDAEAMQDRQIQIFCKHPAPIRRDDLDADGMSGRSLMMRGFRRLKMLSAANC